MEQIVFDIETGGLPKDEILYLMPEFSAPSNYKDAEKIQAVKAKKEEEWLLNSALSALSGKVLAIGVQKSGNDVKFFTDDDEEELLKNFWNFYRENASATFVGFNSNSFDLPFLVRRSWANKVIVPNIFNGKYLSYKFVDLIQVWGCGTVERISLDTLSKFFNVGAKNGNGANFASMWEINKDAALDYLRNDVLLTRAIGEAMGVIEAEVSYE